MKKVSVGRIWCSNTTDRMILIGSVSGQSVVYEMASGFILHDPIYIHTEIKTIEANYTYIGNIWNVVSTIDKQTGAVYVYIKPELSGVRGCVKRTIEITNNIYVDLDENNDIIGVEVL